MNPFQLLKPRKSLKERIARRRQFTDQKNYSCERERERDESYLDNPIAVLLTKRVANCVKNQAADSTIKRNL